MAFKQKISGDCPSLPPGLSFTVRFSTRRRTLALAVTLTGEVVVHAPAGTPEAAIRQALARHRDWLARTTAERRRALAALQPGCAYYLGQPLAVEVTSGASRGVARRGESLIVCQPSPEPDPWPLLVAWYRREAAAELASRIRHYAPRLGVRVAGMELRDWKRRWGECRPAEGLVRLHWRLILLPLELVDYVVVHELAHLEVPGHPPRFWARVTDILPDWPMRRRRLNGEWAPFLGWRWHPKG